MSLPYFPMFPKDFEAKTSHLTMVEDGAYNRLLRICWMTPGCTIPADEKWIMRRARAITTEEQEAVRFVLSEFFTQKGGRFINSKLVEIWQEAETAHKKRKSAGIKGGLAKSLKSKETEPSNAQAMLKQPEPEPEPYNKKKISNDISQKNEVKIFADHWNDFADQFGLAKIVKLSSAREAALRQRLTFTKSVEGLIEILHQTENMPFLMGVNDKGWKMDFDFFVRESSFLKIVEGKYLQRKAVQPKSDLDRAIERMEQAEAAKHQQTNLLDMPK